MTAITFADIDTAMAATVRPVRLYVRIGNQAVNATEAHTRHGVDNLVGTCTVYVRAPRTANIAINAEIEIEAGYAGATRRIFHGFIPDDESITDQSGHMLRIDGVGWASRFAHPERAGIEITGPVSLKDAFRSLCLLRSIPTYFSDDTTYVDGATEIMLGGNTQINAGHIRLDNRTSPADWLQRVPPLFGYRVFDSPDGAVRMARVSGIPPITLTDIGGEPFAVGDAIRKNDLEVGSWYLFAEPFNVTAANRISVLAATDWGMITSILGSSNSSYEWAEVQFTGLPLGYVALYPLSDGIERYSRITPPAAMTYTQGVNCHRLSKTRDRSKMMTSITVEGARYTDADGGTTQIRSIPDSVPYAAELDPPGYIADTVSSQDITTAVQAEGVRNALEVDRSEVYEEVSWECAGRPDLQPGDVVTVTGDMHELQGQPLWLTSIDASTTDRGYIARQSGWFGSGEALGAGNDAVTVDVPIPGDGVAHMGNQTISWYRDTTADDTEMTIDITVLSEDYTSLRLIGLAHGTNTYGTGNVANPTTGSVIEVWQLDDPSVAEGSENELSRKGSLELPTLDEEYARRRNYASSDTYWTAFSLPLSGSLKVGAAELRIISGENPDGFDDYEVTDLQLVYAGVGIPSLPGSVG